MMKGQSVKSDEFVQVDQSKAEICEGTARIPEFARQPPFGLVGQPAQSELIGTLELPVTGG